MSMPHIQRYTITKTDPKWLKEIEGMTKDFLFNEVLIDTPAFKLTGHKLTDKSGKTRYYFAFNARIGGDVRKLKKEEYSSLENFDVNAVLGGEWDYVIASGSRTGGPITYQLFSEEEYKSIREKILRNEEDVRTIFSDRLTLHATKALKALT